MPKYVEISAWKKNLFLKLKKKTLPDTSYINTIIMTHGFPHMIFEIRMIYIRLTAIKMNNNRPRFHSTDSTRRDRNERSVMYQTFQRDVASQISL